MGGRRGERAAPNGAALVLLLVGGKEVLQMLKGKMVFQGKSGGGKGAEDWLCAPREGEQLSAAAPGIKMAYLCWDSEQGGNVHPGVSGAQLSIRKRDGQQGSSALTPRG